MYMCVCIYSYSDMIYPRQLFVIHVLADNVLLWTEPRLTSNPLLVLTHGHAPVIRGCLQNYRSQFYRFYFTKCGLPVFVAPS